MMGNIRILQMLWYQLGYIFINQLFIRVWVQSDNPNMSDPKQPIPKESPTKPLFSIFHERSDVRRNQHAVHFFYNEVLKDYYGRLKNIFEAGTGRKSAFKDEQSLQRFDQAVKYYYNDSMSFYTRCVKKRESSEKEEQEDVARMDSMEWKMPQGMFSQEESESCLFRLPQFRTSYIPKIVHSHPQPTQEKQEKQQILQIPQQKPQTPKKQIEQKEYTGSNISSQGHEDYSNYAYQAQCCTSALMVGSFHSSRIKRRPKQQRIFLDMENVFIKLAINGRDCYFQKAAFDLKKIEKKNAPVKEEVNNIEQEEKDKGRESLVGEKVQGGKIEVK